MNDIVDLNKKINHYRNLSSLFEKHKSVEFKDYYFPKLEDKVIWEKHLGRNNGSKWVKKKDGTKIKVTSPSQFRDFC